MKDDATLLADYARRKDEAAFAELVRRHLNFVYAAALRQVNGDAHLAQDVAQLVFTDLARKAGALGHRPVLAGWLFTSTRYAAAKQIRTEQRRRNREQEVHAMEDTPIAPETNAPDWATLRPVLDAALMELGESDRTAVLLRHLQELDFAAVGQRLGLSDNAARMRTERALDKLRAVLARRGIRSTTAALAAVLAQQAAVAAPVGAAASVTGAALAGVSAGGGLLAFMSLTKLQWVAASVALAAGAGVALVQQHTTDGLHAELAATPAATKIDPLRAANRTLAEAAQAANALKVDEAEWVRLREEVVGLQAQVERQERVARAAQAEAREQARRTALPLDELDREPRVAIRTPPVYPAALRDAKVPGSVLVEFVIDATGKLASARVLKSSSPEFEAPTLAALAGWRFSPGLKGGRQVNTRVQQVFEYDPSSAPAAEPPEGF